MIGAGSGGWAFLDAPKNAPRFGFQPIPCRIIPAHFPRIAAPSLWPGENRAPFTRRARLLNLGWLARKGWSWAMPWPEPRRVAGWLARTAGIAAPPPPPRTPHPPFTRPTPRILNFFQARPGCRAGGLVSGVCPPGARTGPVPKDQARRSPPPGAWGGFPSIPCHAVPWRIIAAQSEWPRPAFGRANHGIPFTRWARPPSRRASPKGAMWKSKIKPPNIGPPPGTTISMNGLPYF
ncbi:hypothetical protein SAMN02949497_1300 [Methylomagnum ishizawai]|uniref:Uncharacterized protein n=1 Tax=Methylomagnum ishizawai TaxID=1760988 RepID=A0A1Y6CUA3_9GAMM|nr:hypothetical protein SAMN02949497_1300 [Methylomagnum ishizawai]